MQRNEQLDASLLLFDVKGTVADVLRPHTDHIAPPLAGIEEKAQRQPRTGAYWVVPLELGDLTVRPAMVALGPDANGPHLTGRIVGT